MTTFKIHPAIGVARLGNSDQFYLAPEQQGELPIACNADGTIERDHHGQPKRVTHFKQTDDLSKIKRQAANFRIFAYDKNPAGEELKIGQQYDFLTNSAAEAPYTVKGTVTDIQWTVHLANKKAAWYEFKQTQGMHGYSDDHLLRNPEVVQPDLRRQLIIDPGPQTVSGAQPKGSFAKGYNQAYPQTFPPQDIKPHSIDTLGELLVAQEDDHQRLLVLGGLGKAGSSKPPVITSFVNNDGWFDDISDGPVTAVILFDYQQHYTDANGKPKTEKKSSQITVQVPAWVVVGYPRYAPQMMDMITMDEAMYDLFVREFGYNPRLFGQPPFDQPRPTFNDSLQRQLWTNSAHYNPNFYPDFYRDIWPIFARPNLYKYTFQFDDFVGGDPHNTGTGGNLDEQALSQPPKAGNDPHLGQRQFIYGILRQSNQLNQYKGATTSKDPNTQPKLMPMLCGDNPLDNTAPSKFLALTQTQLFMLKQWADGHFINSAQEWGQNDPDAKNPWAQPPLTGEGIDRAAVTNMLGGAFCPGGEISWIINNPALYSEPYRIKHAPYLAGQLSIPAPIAAKDGSPAPDLAAGSEPGDLTKYTGVPWHADFHECTYQNINVTYDNWNNIELASTGDPAQPLLAYDIPWWPAHRPVVIYLNDNGAQAYWASGIPANNAGDLQMVEAWKDLGFLRVSAENNYLQQERNDAVLGPPISPGDLIQGDPHQR